MKRKMQVTREISFTEFSDIYNRYLVEDFPEDEIKPLYVIENAFAANKHTAYALEEDSKVKAYASFMWKEKRFAVIGLFCSNAGSWSWRRDWLYIPSEIGSKYKG